MKGKNKKEANVTQSNVWRTTRESKQSYLPHKAKFPGKKSFNAVCRNDVTDILSEFMIGGNVTQVEDMVNRGPTVLLVNFGPFF